VLRAAAEDACERPGSFAVLLVAQSDIETGVDRCPAAACFFLLHLGHTVLPSPFLTVVLLLVALQPRLQPVGHGSPGMGTVRRSSM
jgi:hypothetical protein